MNWSNQITRLLDIDFPLIQAPMFGVTTPQMVSGATKAGCLGSLPLGDLPPERCLEAIQTTRKLTTKPFSVNLFVNTLPAIDDALKLRYAQAKDYIERLAGDHQLDIVLPEFDSIVVGSYRDQLDFIISENCRIVSFTFGIPDHSDIRRLKENDITLIGTCTSVEEASFLEKSGVDVICVQGLEAGGHRGSFADNNIPLIGGLSLLAQVRETVTVPLVYAGGIYNAQTLNAAKTLGAEGFQVGSLLIGSQESALAPFEKERLNNLNEKDIVLTKSFSGRYARGIRNAFIKAVENTEFILPYPYQNKLTAALRKLAKAQANPDFVSIWVGQSIHSYSNEPTESILKKLLLDVERHWNR